MNARTHSIRDLFQNLPPDPSVEELQPLISALADKAVQVDRPLASVKAYLRHNAGDLDARTREFLADGVMHELTSRRATPQPVAEESGRAGDWYTGSEAAARLQIPWKTLRGRLHLHEHRRRCGYPRWDGYGWKVASLAVEPATAVGFAAALPDHEPLEELLPDWCVREGHSRAPRDARDDAERRLLMRRAESVVGAEDPDG